jgi:hypothetical protein
MRVIVSLLCDAAPELNARAARYSSIRRLVDVTATRIAGVRRAPSYASWFNTRLSLPYTNLPELGTTFLNEDSRCFDTAWMIESLQNG